MYTAALLVSKLNCNCSKIALTYTIDFFYLNRFNLLYHIYTWLTWKLMSWTVAWTSSLLNTMLVARSFLYMHTSSFIRYSLFGWKKSFIWMDVRYLNFSNNIVIKFIKINSFWQEAGKIQTILFYIKNDPDWIYWSFLNLIWCLSEKGNKTMLLYFSGGMCPPRIPPVSAFGCSL